MTFLKYTYIFQVHRKGTDTRRSLANIISHKLFLSLLLKMKCDFFFIARFSQDCGFWIFTGFCVCFSALLYSICYKGSAPAIFCGACFCNTWQTEHHTPQPSTWAARTSKGSSQERLSDLNNTESQWPVGAGPTRTPPPGCVSHLRTQEGLTYLHTRLSKKTKEKP